MAQEDFDVTTLGTAPTWGAVAGALDPSSPPSPMHLVLRGGPGVGEVRFTRRGPSRANRSSALWIRGGIDADTIVFPTVRVQDDAPGAETWYELWVFTNGSDKWTFRPRKRIAGSASNIGGGDVEAVLGFEAVVEVRLMVRGDEIVCQYRKAGETGWTTTHSFTDSSISGAGRWGFGFSNFTGQDGRTMRVDNARSMATVPG